jgi:hypothetical protein
LIGWLPVDWMIGWLIDWLIDWLVWLQPMMDRNKKDELPKMQVGFIDAICLPVYKVGVASIWLLAMVVLDLDTCSNFFFNYIE